MNTLQLTNAAKLAVLSAVELSIDMYNDMALDPLYFTPNEIRNTATMSDEEIRRIVSNRTKEASENIDKLVELELLRQQILGM